MENALEITIISVLGGIIAALIAGGVVGFFWLASRIDRLAKQHNTTHNELSEKIAQTNESIALTNSQLSERIAQSHNELSERIAQSHNELSAKIDLAIGQLREDFTRQLERTKAEIINALVNHTHPGPNEPPVFTAPPPVSPADSPAREPELSPSDD